MTGARRVEVRPSTYPAFCRDPEGSVLEIVPSADVVDYRPDLHERSA
jgi:lactoylglutathione lyase